MPVSRWGWRPRRDELCKYPRERVPAKAVRPGLEVGGGWLVAGVVRDEVRRSRGGEGGQGRGRFWFWVSRRDARWVLGREVCASGLGVRIVEPRGKAPALCPTGS